MRIKKLIIFNLFMQLHEYSKKYNKNKKFVKEYKRIEKKENLEYEISQLITEARRYANLTQTQLAKAIKTKQPAIARVENGSHLPNVLFLKRIADSIGTNLIIRWGFMVKAEINTKARATATSVDSYEEQEGFIISPFTASMIYQSRSATKNILEVANS